MNRRTFVKWSSIMSAGVSLMPAKMYSQTNSFPVVRTPKNKRNFNSPIIEKTINEIASNIKNKHISWLFSNCFPNTLDTTVFFELNNGIPDTYVITGDIDAMWLRDSSAQVWPYVQLCQQEKNLQLLIAGVINRQTYCINKDPYANAFYKDEKKISEWHNDVTLMQPGIHERKWEIDSLCYPIRLAYGYWKQTKDVSVFTNDWLKAMRKVVATFKEQQRLNSKGDYSFMRSSPYATDSVPMGGYGYPAKPNGLICSMFRPSDDATVFPYLLPSNFFALHSLKQLLEIVTIVNLNFDTKDLKDLITTLDIALNENAYYQHPQFGKIIPYEINGYGSSNLMDDANVPSLLALSYLVPDFANKDIYSNTRKFVLSNKNPFFFAGKEGEGIGGPHVGMDMIWPISIIMRAMTSNSDDEIKQCLNTLQNTHAGTGFMHESFHKDDATKYTRKWFAWANTLFGELILKVYRERKHLLD